MCGRPHAARRYSSTGRRRSRFFAAARRFASSRFSFDAFVGRVSFRFFGTRKAAATSSTSRASAASRFRNWLRFSAATTRSRPSASSRAASFSAIRAFCSGVGAAEAAKSHASSTRLATLLTFCPPGPPARVARNSSSPRGIRSPLPGTRRKASSEVVTPGNYVSLPAMHDLPALRAHLAGLGRALLGYSGGVDSALLAVAGRQALGADAFLAVIGRSASYPEAQWRAARELAERFEVPLLEVDTAELDDPSYRANPVNRCFFCKSELWRVLGRVADERGFDVILDGTNADDLREHRPGFAAGQSAAVRSPLAELGWTKAMVREAAHDLGIPVWDAPAAPCLSSRIRYGLEVTPERLRQVELAEEHLRGLGIAGDLRVRHLGALARVEVSPGELPVARTHWRSIHARLLELGFAGAELDPDGYRRGGLLALAGKPA